MRAGLFLLMVVLLLAGICQAHRLDEYLQAALITPRSDRVEIQLNLTPGVAVLPVVLAAIDSDGDGKLSDAEKGAYARRVVRDLAISADQVPVRPLLVSSRFPEIGEMREGNGEIRLELTAQLPGPGRIRRVRIENRHMAGVAAYLANALVSRDPEVRIERQVRNYSQSVYEVDYTVAGGSGWRFGGPLWIALLALVPVARIVANLRGGKGVVWRRRFL